MLMVNLLRRIWFIDDSKIVDITGDNTTCSDYLDCNGMIVFPGSLNCFFSGNVEKANSEIEKGATSVLFSSRNDVKSIEGIKCNYGFCYELNETNIDEPVNKDEILCVEVFSDNSDERVLKKAVKSFRIVCARGFGLGKVIEIIKAIKGCVYL
jgi:hypothetical protein